MEKYSDGKLVYILGDFNLDLLKSESCNCSHRFLLSLQSCHFMLTIDKPTRVHGNSATLIHNIFTNCPEQHINSGNISDISDHFTQFCMAISPSSKPSKFRKKIRSFSNFSEERFLKELANLDFLLRGDVDQIFSCFYEKVNKLMNKHAPLKNPYHRTIRNFSQLWTTKGIRIKINYLLKEIGIHINFIEITLQIWFDSVKSYTFIISSVKMFTISKTYGKVSTHW